MTNTDFHVEYSRSFYSRRLPKRHTIICPINPGLFDHIHDFQGLSWPATWRWLRLLFSFTPFTVFSAFSGFTSPFSASSSSDFSLPKVVIFSLMREIPENGLWNKNVQHQFRKQKLMKWVTFTKMRRSDSSVFSVSFCLLRSVLFMLIRKRDKAWGFSSTNVDHKTNRIPFCFSHNQSSERLKWLTVILVHFGYSLVRRRNKNACQERVSCSGNRPLAKSMQT